jgi:transposase
MEGSLMARRLLTDDQWDLIKDIFPEPAATGRPPVDRRKVVNGIFWILRTGSPWRDLPAEFGTWKTCWRLFDQWNADGTLDLIVSRLRAALADVGEIDQELWCIDGTIVRAARCAAGRGKKTIRRNLLITR